MRTLGEAGTVAIKSKINPKLHNKGVTCMFVGYAENHDRDCYEMWHKATNRCLKTRDVVFLHRMYYQKETVTNELTIEPMILSISANTTNNTSQVMENNNINYDAIEHNNNDDNQSSEN